MTITNYLGLNQLAQKFGDRLQILAFPCGQFYNQEPGQNTEILNGLKYVRPGSGYVPLFPLMEKSLVNGATINPVYTWLRARCPGTTTTIGDPQYISWSPIDANDITWNFEKFLIDTSGHAVRRYSPGTPPLNLVQDIQQIVLA
eukprot:TRINITY_DN8665_c0_g1_i2.p1 TRINITY_DN8665_c0_g1~~TRINITY_DN8665_c0_g1_i2.p1  ORF type:complete len:144 (-),score=22.75 TRINITY_DN8665_c0_g1_i2:250-681(-)